MQAILIKYEYLFLLIWNIYIESILQSMLSIYYDIIHLI